jgi:hypothetical protein
LTLDETIRLMAVLAAAFPQVQTTRETVDIYAISLGDIPFDLGMAAVMGLVKTSEWFPKVAEIRGEVSRLRREWGAIPPAYLALPPSEKEMEAVGRLAKMYLEKLKGSGDAPPAEAIP